MARHAENGFKASSDEPSKPLPLDLGSAPYEQFTVPNRNRDVRHQRHAHRQAVAHILVRHMRKKRLQAGHVHRANRLDDLIENSDGLASAFAAHAGKNARIVKARRGRRNRKPGRKIVRQQAPKPFGADHLTRNCGVTPNAIFLDRVNEAVNNRPVQRLFRAKMIMGGGRVHTGGPLYCPLTSTSEPVVGKVLDRDFDQARACIGSLADRIGFIVKHRPELASQRTQVNHLIEFDGSSLGRVAGADQASGATPVDDANHAAAYRAKRVSALDAITCIPSGAKIAVGMGVAQPPALLNSLAARAAAGAVSDLRLYYMLSTAVAARTVFRPELRNRIRSISLFHGETERALDRCSTTTGVSMVDLVPVGFSAVPQLLIGTIRVDTLLTTVSSPDADGYFSLGTNTDYARVVSDHAARVIVEVNSCMTRVFGNSRVHLSRIMVLVENNAALFESEVAPARPEDVAIGNEIAGLAKDSDCLQHRSYWTGRLMSEPLAQTALCRFNSERV